MEQSLSDQPTSRPKKRRMTFAEWQKANPNHTILPGNEKEVAEITEGIMKFVAQWYRDSEAAARRKTRQFKQAQEKKATPKSSASRRKSKHR
ncbi:MAG: hypothetical protein HY868_18630 [Chloroflexi bacterium]|nr:hypothetical protein [Chloroflexota bacterium]